MGTISDVANRLSSATRSIRLWQVILGILCGAGLSILWYFLYVPTTPFLKSELVVIPQDSKVVAIATQLEEQHIISHPFVFIGISRLLGYDRSIQPGAYLFSQPLGVLAVARTLANGDHGIISVRITLVEGATTFDMAKIFASKLPGISEEAFLDEALASEGYLFPETYFFTPGVTSSEIIARLRAQFDEQLLKSAPEIQSSKNTIPELVILASILEREARGEEDKKMVAGILLNRLRIGMPLQVDAVFGYIQRENGYTPTRTDLESDSPYNTYRNKGLPPGPICNPGLESLLASASPTSTKNLYYLTGKDGMMHYAKTFEEHKKNRALYLD